MGAHPPGAFSPSLPPAGRTPARFSQLPPIRREKIHTPLRSTRRLGEIPPKGDSRSCAAGGLADGPATREYSHESRLWRTSYRNSLHTIAGFAFFEPLSVDYLPMSGIVDGFWDLVFGGCLILILLSVAIGVCQAVPVLIPWIIGIAIVIVGLCVLGSVVGKSERPLPSPPPPKPEWVGTATFAKCRYCHCTTAGVPIFQCLECNQMYCRVCANRKCSHSSSTPRYAQLGTIQP